METFSIVPVDNALGKARRETLNGRPFLVAPVVMLVPGVLNGSGGKLLYRPEQVSRNPAGWNGFPLTAGHPTLNGKPVSARNPKVYNRYFLGHVFEAKFNQSLQGEAWFDEEVTNRVDPRIIRALQVGMPIEVSTGLFLQADKAPEGAVYNGVAYDFDTKNYHPDHLAVLVDEKGACSIDDGCGVNRNSSHESLHIPDSDQRPNFWENFWYG